MDVKTFTALATACAPLVNPNTAHAIALTESSLNPYAIGVVAAQLERQPRSLSEALATAESLHAQSLNFSFGLAQINVHNLKRLNLSMRDAFEPCNNLRGMQVVLMECFTRVSKATAAQEALRKALSCYYSGNFTTGFRHGYVSRVVWNAQRIARAPP